MRIWSLHPRYLDAKGLVALWRETLLAQAVLQGKTKGYTQHPQLERFRAQADPLAAIATYLAEVREEAGRRGYAFDASKIDPARSTLKIGVTDGQTAHEWQHLLAKLALRSPIIHQQFAALRVPDLHPMFETEPGGIASWERLHAP